MLAITLIAVVLAFAQNLLMFAFGLKESAIFSSPLSFGRILLGELILMGAGYLCVRKYLRARQRLVLAAWLMAVLGAAELVLPVSTFATLGQHAKREHVLNRIELVNSVIERAPGRGGTRFALTDTLKFPNRGRYLTYPAWLGPPDRRLFGDYVMKVNPEYYDDTYNFDAGRPYSFTVLFDTTGRPFDFAAQTANIDICDGKDYFMACRIIPVGLAGAPGN